MSKKIFELRSAPPLQCDAESIPATLCSHDGNSLSGIPVSIISHSPPFPCHPNITSVASFCYTSIASFCYTSIASFCYNSVASFCYTSVASFCHTPVFWPGTLSFNFKILIAQNCSTFSDWAPLPLGSLLRLRTIFKNSCTFSKIIPKFANIIFLTSIFWSR